MGKYSIKDLERLSGIKAHTIRIWEKRYRIVEPQRTPTNIRFYTDNDLKKVLNIALLNKAGVKISSIAEMSSMELKQKIEDYALIKDDFKYFLDNLVFATIDMDEKRFEKLLDRAILDYGMEKTMIEIIYPFFKNVGILWLTGGLNPGQEHYISNMVRARLIIAIDKRNEKIAYEKKAVLFLPENEWHELGLMFFHFICLGLKVKPIYLGQSVPLSSIEAIIKSKKPDYLVFSHLSVKSQKAFRTHLEKLTKIAKNQEIIFIDRPGDKNSVLADFDIYNPLGVDDFKNYLSV